MLKMIMTPTQCKLACQPAEGVSLVLEVDKENFCLAQCKSQTVFPGMQKYII